MKIRTVKELAEYYAHEALGKQIMVTYDGVKFHLNQRVANTTRDIVGVYENAPVKWIFDDMMETLEIHNYTMRSK